MKFLPIKSGGKWKNQCLSYIKGVKSDFKKWTSTALCNVLLQLEFSWRLLVQPVRGWLAGLLSLWEHSPQCSTGVLTAACGRFSSRLWIKRQKINWHGRGMSRELGGDFFPSLASLIQQNGNGLFVFPNAYNNCSDRFVIASTASLPQRKLLYF